MQANNRVLDDLVKVANGALGAVTGVKSEVENAMRQQFERVLSQMDVVPREEFDVVEAMAAKARTENEALSARLAAVEARLDALETPVAPAAKTEGEAE